MSRKDGAIGIISIEDSVDESIRGLKDYIKKSKRMLITVTNNKRNNIRTNKTTTKLGNRNGKKNNCMDISSNKQSKSPTKKPRHGYARETLREKLNLF